MLQKVLSTDGVDVGEQGTEGESRQSGAEKAEHRVNITEEENIT